MQTIINWSLADLTLDGKKILEHHEDRVEDIEMYCKAIEVMWKNGDDEEVNVVDVTILERLSDEECIWQ